MRFFNFWSRKPQGTPIISTFFNDFQLFTIYIESCVIQFQYFFYHIILQRQMLFCQQYKTKTMKDNKQFYILNDKRGNNCE